MLELLKSEYAVIQKLSLLALDRASQDGTVYTLYCLHCGHHLNKVSQRHGIVISTMLIFTKIG